MNTARDDLTERLVDAAEERLARDARRLLAPFDHHVLTARLGAEVRRRRRQRYSIAAAAAVMLAGGFALWSIHDWAPALERRIVAHQPIPPEAVKVAKPRRIAHPPVQTHDQPGGNIQLTTDANSQVTEPHLRGPTDSDIYPETGSPLVGIPFVIEPAEGSGRQPVFGIYVPGGVQPLEAEDLTPAEQRAIYRVLGIQYVSTESNTL